MLFSLRMVVLLHKWEFKNIEVEFLKGVKKFDHQDFQILVLFDSASTVMFSVVSLPNHAFSSAG